MISYKGGEKDGGAQFTPTGKAVLAQYLKLAAKLNTIIEKETELLTLI